MKASFIFVCLIAPLVIHVYAQAQPELLKTNENFLTDFQKQFFIDHHRVNKVEPLAAFLSVDPEITHTRFSEIDRHLESFCNKLKTRKPVKEKEAFLRYVFYKVHKEYLREYKINSSLYKTFGSGDYDCVSGTALYALVLNKLGINHTIKETKFHVYLLTSYAGKEQLWESTDPIDGFINKREEIQEREKKYSEAVEKNDNIYFFQGEINSEINIIQLSGLQYYNEGIDFYNNKNIEASLLHFEKALRLYRSDRIEEIFKISLKMLAQQISENANQNTVYNYYSKLIGN